MEFTTNPINTMQMIAEGERGQYVITEITFHRRIWWEVDLWQYDEPVTIAMFPSVDAATEYVRTFDPIR
jgi:hypothetical protein